MKAITAKANCEDCKQDFEYIVIGGCPPLRYCEQCHLIRWPHPDPEEEMRKARAATVKTRWDFLCPAKYRLISEGGETDPVRLPQALLRRLTDWKPAGPKIGISAHGITGRSKTRCMWRVMRAHFEAGRKIIAFDCAEFSHSLTAAFRDGTEDRWRRRVWEADVVFFDDLWKDTMTERVDSELFAMLERLSSNRTPYFITTNFTGELLLERAKRPDSKMSLDRLVPLLRRIREDCEWIPFVGANETQ